jgi:DNA-binding SARP family transcriptional activator
MAGSASLSVLGGFDLSVSQRSISLTSNAQRVLGFVAVSGSAQQRDVVAGQLWPLGTQERAMANLRTALWRIRQASPRLIRTSRDTIGLEEVVQVDYTELGARARRLLGGMESTEETVMLPHRPFEQDLLPGWDEEWLLLERERYRQLRIHALEALSVQLTSAGRFALAIDVACAAIRAEPLHESAHVALITAHLAEGNRAEALRQFDSYRDLLHRETGLSPSAELESLVPT